MSPNGCTGTLFSGCYVEDNIFRRYSLLQQNLFESSPKISVEDGVYDGVERGVAVSEPEGRGETRGGDVALCAQGLQDVQHEEREPGQDEGRHDQAQDEGGSPFPRLGQTTLLSLGVRRQGPRGQVAVGTPRLGQRRRRTKLRPSRRTTHLKITHLHYQGKTAENNI